MTAPPVPLVYVGLLLFELILVADARAATWNVPADAATIQAGLDLAAPGDTVAVDPGTYSGPGNRDLDFHGKAAVLRSVAGAAATILDCQASGRGFIFQTSEGNGSVVEGFTIANGRIARGGAIYCNAASPTILDCVLIANRADETGGALSCQFGASPRLMRCRIEGNNSFLSGGGVSLINASAEITDCTLTGNSAGILGGGIYLREASPTITTTRIVDNQSNGAGGGLTIYHLSAPIVTACTIAGNRASGSAGGAFCDDFASPTFVSCVVTGNHSAFSGGGILCTNRSTASIQRSTLSGNQATQAGGGLYAENLSMFNLERTILWGNCAAANKEAHLVDLGSGAQFSCCDVDSSGVGGAGSPTYVVDNTFADPLFCAALACSTAPASGGDYGLGAASPCAASASPCDSLIGALDPSCGVTDAAIREGNGELVFSPTPFHDRLVIQFRLGGPSPSLLTVHDVAGRLVWSHGLETSVGTIVWDGRDRSGRSAPPGMYFVRIANQQDVRVRPIQRLRR